MLLQEWTATMSTTLEGSGERKNRATHTELSQFTQ
jgi:hypothetical protein